MCIGSAQFKFVIHLGFINSKIEKLLWSCNWIKGRLAWFCMNTIEIFCYFILSFIIFTQTWSQGSQFPHVKDEIVMPGLTLFNLFYRFFISMMSMCVVSYSSWKSLLFYWLFKIFFIILLRFSNFFARDWMVENESDLMHLKLVHLKYDFHPVVW